jgi:hypothetical protein
MLGFERAGARQVAVVGLRGAQRCQLDAELVKVEGGNFLVEVFLASAKRTSYIWI